jgi:hypothetical protein
MWTGLLIVMGILLLVGVGQWWVTRPTSRRPVDTSRGRAALEAEYGKDPTRLNDVRGIDFTP